MMMFKSGDMDYTQKMKRCHEYVEALEEEQKKIQVFQRELPLCLELVTQAIESCRKELSGSSEHVGGQSDCSERTTSECGGGGGAVFEEFIPIKWSSSSSDETDKDEEAEKNGGDKKKSDWLRSVQLWNQSPDPKPKEDHVINKKTNVIEVKRNAGAFQPFQKEKPKAADSLPLKTITPTSTTTSSSTAETVGGKSEFEDQKQSHSNRKQRRCWSPELHRRFLHALQQLGGSHVATPKQIRDLMKVDGLTNDEVKSHLQKYRLHTRRPATPVVTNGGENPQQRQFMVVEGIWVPSHDTTNNRVYAPVAVQSSPSGERSSRRCKSPTTSSSTHTTPSSSFIDSSQFRQRLDMARYQKNGIYGKIDGNDIYIGNKRIASRAGCSTVPETEIDTKGGKTVGYVYVGERLAGVFNLSDACRSGVSQAMTELKSLGIKTAMLTGDSQAAAMHAQEQLGNVLDVVHGELLPEDKSKIIQEFKKEGPTAMVGDGVNDAPALATADIP